MSRMHSVNLYEYLGDRPLYAAGHHEKRASHEHTDARLRISLLIEKVKGIEHELNSLKEHVHVQEQDINRLQSATGQLASAFHGYLDVRNRFIETFRREVLGLPPSRSVIVAGDFDAHNGDAAVDYLLYTRGLRKDTGVMQILYGLTPEQVSTLSTSSQPSTSHPLNVPLPHPSSPPPQDRAYLPTHPPHGIDESHDDKALRLLNAHATLRANSEKGISEDLEIAFSGFIVTLQENLEESLIMDRQTPLGRAYRRFWTCYAKQVNEEFM
ncbi:hypothetical protein MMC14_005780 [Varicellaria rhodocarpa]|nr:hypothetical protein [Varicellaria rhodocarpa]